MDTDITAMLSETASLPDFVPTKEPGIAKLRYSHEAMIEMIVADPAVHQNELARRFGMTPCWISIVVNSDAFQAMLHKRMGEVWGEYSVSMADQLKGLMARSMEILRAKLDSHPSNVPDQLALRTLELTSRAAGYGAREGSTTIVNVTQQIDDAGDQLVHLLRRKKAEVQEADFKEITNETP